MPFMSTMFNSIFYVFALLFISTNVSALPLVARDVVAPPITSPKAGTVWQAGSKQTVTWDTSGLPPPANITNKIGTVVLGFQTADSLNLNFDSPLAQGFPITQGSIEITVPQVVTRNNYIIVLMGDSGNTSPQFTITATPPQNPISEVPSTTSDPADTATTSAPSTTSTTETSTPPSSSSTSSVVDAPSSTILSSTSTTSSGSAPVSTPTTPTSTPSTSSSTTGTSSSAGTSQTPTGGSSSNGAWSTKQINFSTVTIAVVLTAFVMF